MDRFLLEVLGSVLEPMALVGEDRRILYATPSFKRLTGLLQGETACLEVFRPAFSPDRTPCCWDLALWYKGGEPGIWLTQDLDQALLCRVTRVTLNGSTAFLLLRMEPILPQAPLPCSFPLRQLFRGLSQSLGTESYRKYAALLLKKTYGLKEVAWLSPKEGGGLATLARKALAALPSPLPFDLAYGEECYHAFPGTPPEQPLLLVRGLGNVGARDLLNFLWALGSSPGENRKDRAGTEGLEGLGAYSPLTQREWQILALVAEGSDNKKIAATLGISPNTVKNHMKSILAKTQSRSRTELVRRYFQALADQPLPGASTRNPTLAKGRRLGSKSS
ncbi:MAG: helix-turn-helix transcriptional regulator [Thermus sp.]|nr:helix-turn-helix transcriptional regulator [Thermus sp.]